MVRCALAILLSLAAMSSQAGVFKCVNAKGQTTFQDSPCQADKPATAAAIPQGPFRVELLVVGHNADIEQWLQMPAKLRKPDTARLRHVRRGQLLLAPIVIVNYSADKSGAVPIYADFQLISPTGTVALKANAFTAESAKDSHTPGVMVLNPILNITSDSDDMLGSYVVRATVRNGVSTAQAEERFELEK